ncbi:hypothetical protein MGYG_08110 [Nannizzia gypsea CBS 118893]|uniref:Uncharacterized protein n=1 Tax=Arthroderma gypseum (strain ATCC MYA-4604 / CBS 118893) TaxID=535722 RepID=E4V527_ARTGP|nr:hypothetical protein MGYG_08110 [Nannizzia gypsea CBS 118893]EFR05101.1 hypothetical protein MGYG_08110 [Nannizzia gypsea CBS 118893]
MVEHESMTNMIFLQRPASQDSNMSKTSPPPPYSAVENMGAVKRPEGAGMTPHEDAVEFKRHQEKMDQLCAEAGEWRRAKRRMREREKERRREREAEMKREKEREKERRKEWKRGREREIKMEWSRAKET